MRLSLSALLGKIEMSRGTAGRLQKATAAAVLLFLYLPIAIVVLLSFTPEQSPTFPMPGLSLRWYESLIEDQAFVNAIVFSSKLAVVSALGSGLIGLLAAFGLVRGDFGDTWLSEDFLRILFSLPIIIPFIITGIGGLVFFNFVGIYSSFSSLVVGHIMITLPFTSLVIASGLEGLDESLEEAARNLGATQLRSYVEVTIPMIMPSIIAALLFAFILVQQLHPDILLAELHRPDVTRAHLRARDEDLRPDVERRRNGPYCALAAHYGNRRTDL